LGLAACAASAQSQPPAPTPSIRADAPQQQADAQNTDSNRQNPPVIAALSQQPTQQPPEDATKQNNQPPSNWWDWFSANGANWAIVALTIVLAIIGGFQWWATHTANKHNVVIERAYLALSHHPPGIDIDPLVIQDSGDAKQNLAIYVGVKNLGNTPANVTYTLIQLKLFPSNEPLPPFPPYDESALRRMWVNVVKTNEFTIFQNQVLDLFTIEQIRKGVLKLYVFGYADYIDKFAVRHRCGFARVYNPDMDDRNRYLNPDGTINQEAAAERNNLHFVTEPNYNYDRKREKNEGKDWDEPQQK
jgi:hypothetical protein